jgi:hypothetical protein
MISKTLKAPKIIEVPDQPKTRYFKTIFSHGISWDQNTLGKFVDRAFVESVIYSKYPETTWIGETVEISESELPIRANRLN